MMSTDPLYSATFIAVISCWFVFAAVFFLRRKPRYSRERKSDRGAAIGVLVAALGYACVWSFRRKEPSIVADGGVVLAYLLSALAILLAVGSVWLTATAVRRLGKQWAVAARVVEHHELITDGPYAVVRNPIYTGMLGMLIATGLALSEWWALVLGVVIYLIGTGIRIRAEERLLREAFREKFEVYAKSVPAIVPGIFRQSRR